MSSPQVVALAAGAVQLPSVRLGVLDVGEPHRALLACTGLLGVMCAKDRPCARLHGAGLVVG